MAHPTHPHHHHSAKPATSPAWMQVIFVVSVVAVVFILSTLLRGHRAMAPTVNTEAVITIKTDDGLTLSAQLSLPPGSGQVPAVILAHEFSQDHHQWDPYVQDFLHAGFAVLVYDIRGFGGSKLPTIPTDFNAWYNAMPNDVPAIMTALKQRTRIKADNINMVGAVLGANIAYVASGSHLGLHRVVVLSPKITKGVLDGGTVKDFSPTGVLGIADAAGQENLVAIMKTAHDPQSTFAAADAGSGVDLLKQSDVLGSVLSWLKQ